MSFALQQDISSYFSQRFDVKQTSEDVSVSNKNYAPDLLKTLQALNWHGDVRAMRDALPHGIETLGFTDFLNAMSSLGYAPKVMEVGNNGLNENMLPCLFVPKNKKNAHDGAILFDVPEGHTQGTAYVFHEDMKADGVITDKTISMSKLKWFSKLLLRFKRVFKQVLIASLVINLLALVTPLFMMGVYDKVIGAHSPETMKYFITGVLLAISVEFALRTLRARSLSWFGARIDHIVSNAILERLLSLPASYTEKASVAAQLSRLKAFESVREFFTSSLFLSFVELPFTLILIAAIGLIAGPLVLIPLIIAGLYLILLLVMRPKLKALTTRLAEASAHRQSMNIETLGKQDVLRYAGGAGAWLERYEKASAESSYASYRYAKTVAMIDTLSQNMIILGGIAMIYYGVERIWADQMSMGALIAVLILTWRSLAPMQSVCMALPRLDQVRKNIDQINRLMDLKPERSPLSITQDAPNFQGEVEFFNVGLRYSKDAHPVYAGLSFIADAGQLIAITGSNSTGKSTTLKLVSGLYQPQAGAVRIDGVDIRQIDPVKLRQNIAYVGQSPDFFTGTLEDNLRLVCPQATYSEIGRAIKKAGLDEWVQSLSDGLDTIIGDQGEEVAQLPASMYPQLALARAYLQEGAILLIDELPYEFLNSDAGKEFYEFLKDQRGKRTILYITYRKDYLDLADKVLYLYQDGRPQIKEQKHA